MARKEEDSNMCIKLVRTVDDGVREILAKATDVKLYKYQEPGKWISCLAPSSEDSPDKDLINCFVLYHPRGTSVPTNTEGMLIFYRRTDNPPFGLLLLSRDSTNHWNQKFGTDVEIQLRAPFLLYKSFDIILGNCIEALWFPDRDRCEEMYKKVRTSSSQPTNLSYAAMVAGSKQPEGNGVEKGDLEEEQEMEQRGRQAEQAVKALRVPGKMPPCQHCGKATHLASKCWYLQERPGVRSGPMPRGAGKQKGKPNEITQTLTFEAKKQTSPHIEQTASATSHFVDSAILESSSSSSGGPLPQMRQPSGQSSNQQLAMSPLNLSSLLSAAPAPAPSSGSLGSLGSSATLPHGASFPNMAGEKSSNWSSQNPQLALRVASDQLKGILGMGSVTAQKGDLSGVESGRAGLTLSGCSVDGDSSGHDTTHRFVKDVTERLNQVQGPYRNSSEESASQMALRPPHHFEASQSQQDAPQSFLLPEDMEGGRMKRQPVGVAPRSAGGRLEFLTKEQLLQSMEWLMHNDRDFVNKLHEGYIRSLMHNLKL